MAQTQGKGKGWEMTTENIIKALTGKQYTHTRTEEVITTKEHTATFIVGRVEYKEQSGGGPVFYLYPEQALFNDNGDEDYAIVFAYEVERLIKEGVLKHNHIGTRYVDMSSKTTLTSDDK